MKHLPHRFRLPVRHDALIVLAEGGRHRDAFRQDIAVAALHGHRDIKLLEQIEQSVERAAGKRVGVEKKRLLERRVSHADELVQMGYRTKLGQLNHVIEHAFVFRRAIGEQDEPGIRQERSSRCVRKAVPP